MQSVHTLLKLAQLSWTGHVTRMPEECLPKKILYGELEMGKRFYGSQKKRCKDTLNPSLKDFNIPIESWEQMHRTEQSGEDSSEEVLLNMRQKQSAKPSRNVHSAKSDLCFVFRPCICVYFVHIHVTWFQDLCFAFGKTVFWGYYCIFFYFLFF